MMKRLVLAFAVLSLCACAGQEKQGESVLVTATVTATSSASLTPASTPTPVYWSQKEAAERYLTMVKPVNAAITEMGSTFEVSDETWRTLRSQCAAIVTANDVFMRSLASGSWAPSIRPAVDAVITSSSASHSWWVRCAAAKSREEIETLGDVTQQDPGAAQRLRVLLGLPSVSG